MPAPFLHGTKPPESLAGHVHELANQFASVASVLEQQYTDLNTATNGLLDGTFPWTGIAASKFFETWQNFGTYMQQMQRSCEQTHSTLVKLSSAISDIEGEQAWDFLLMVAGGIMTIVSFAAAIAELGLNPFVDGFFTAISTFTEREGVQVSSVAEEITQADAQAASELLQIEEELTTSPILTGSMGSSVGGDIAVGISETDLNELTLSASDNLNSDAATNWLHWVDDNTVSYPPKGSLNGITTDNGCAPSAARMLLEDNGITSFSKEDIISNVGYTPGGTSFNSLVKGLRQMGLSNAKYEPDMGLSELRNITNTGKPVLVGVNLSLDPDADPVPHTVLVDGIENTPLGQVVKIRDPLFNPPRAYTMSIQSFAQLWDYGGITY